MFAVGISVCVAGDLLALPLLTANFHTVVAGELYRSAQPSPNDLARYKANLGVATILNLRGANPGKPWYDEEIAAARKLGVTVIDISLLSMRYGHFSVPFFPAYAMDETFETAEPMLGFNES